MNHNTYVEMINISKSFGSVKANDDVNLKVEKGEIHAILGENGAGKSTLMNMLSGFYKPDSGYIYIHDEEVKFDSPRDSIEKGIGMIHQHYKLVEAMSAVENITLGQKGNFFLKKNKIRNNIKKVAENYGLNLNYDKKVYDMGIGEKQATEILKVLYQGADILIMDEPTAVLTPQETEKLFAILKNMTEDGCSIIIITHKLHEVMEISDKVTVLRKGKTVKTLDTKKTNSKELTDLMVGEEVDLFIEKPIVERGEEILKVENLTVEDIEKVEVLKDVSFNLHKGEILGVAGVAGSGQKELCEAIAGLYKIKNGKILYEGENLVGLSPRDIIYKGISMSFIPEDRLGMGLVASMDMVDNYLLKEQHKQKGLFIKRKPVKDKCQNMIERLKIQTPGTQHPVKQLSGGNIQKVLIGREIDTNPHVLITAYAVRGLDIASSHTIYDLLNEQKKKGVGILFIGEDLDIILKLCDRIMVLSSGKVTGVLSAEGTTKEKIGLLMSDEIDTEVLTV